MHSQAPAEPDVTSFEATVERVADGAVVLDETYFYPEGGGQPADRGHLDGVPVADVQTEDGDVRHYLAEEAEFDPGDTVTATVDADFRTYCRRAHTASHVLYGAGRRLLDDLGYGGFGITEDRVRVDFETSTTIDDEVLVELERLVNRTVWDSREVTWEAVPREDALSRDDVAFNSRTEEGVTDQVSVRIVEVEGWDVAACGGTHVRNTSEIGPVTVLDRSNPGEGLTRVTMAVGPEAVRRRATEAMEARRAAGALDAHVTDLAGAADRVVEEREALTSEVRDLREQVVTARLSDLEDETVEREGVEWLVGSVPSDDANALAEFAQRLVEETADVVVLVGETGTYLAVATDGAVDAGDVVDDVTAEFGGGGGGGPTAAQAGGLDADPDEIVGFLRD
ncbi:alanyl-tRNA editing protein [Halobacteriales archaeon Cl-PHB]